MGKTKPQLREGRGSAISLALPQIRASVAVGVFNVCVDVAAIAAAKWKGERELFSCESLAHNKIGIEVLGPHKPNAKARLVLQGKTKRFATGGQRSAPFLRSVVWTMRLTVHICATQHPGFAKALSLQGTEQSFFRYGLAWALDPKNSPPPSRE